MVARLTRAEQREQTRRRLIEAAGSVFSRLGFKAAPIDVIAEEAGFSRGAFYSNFESKDALFIELVQGHFDAEIDTLGRALARIDHAEDLAQAVERRYRTLGENSSWCLLTTEFQLYAMRGGRMADRFGEMYEDYRQRMGELLAVHFDRLGVRSSLTPYEFGVAQIALAHGLALQRSASGALDTSLPARALATFTRGALAPSGNHASGGATSTTSAPDPS